MQRKLPVSIVLTSLNEAPLIQTAIERLMFELDGTCVEPHFIVVDDGSMDETVRELRSFVAKKPTIQLIVHAHNEGRGKSVADGIRVSRTEIVGFIDTDLEIPARYVFSFAKSIDEGVDVACAVRYYDFRLRDIIRVILSRGYVMLMRMILSSRLTDTESGLKFFRRSSILKVLDTVMDRRWFWDTEIMVRSDLLGLKITEIPVVVVKRPEIQTTVHLVRDTIYYLRSLLRFRPIVESLRKRRS